MFLNLNTPNFSTFEKKNVNKILVHNEIKCLLSLKKKYNIIYNMFFNKENY